MDEQDQNRAENYDVLALLLTSAPSQQVLDRLTALEGGPSPLGRAYDALARAAGDIDVESVEREFFDLFIGVGRGELLPYASFYVTGFLNERPLAEVRGDLARLGIARQPDNYEPEDRVALLCAVMAAFARGEFADVARASTEAEFFARHLAPWAGLFFKDLAAAPAARFYAAVAAVGSQFIAIEQQAFALAAEEATVN